MHTNRPLALGLLTVLALAPAAAASVSSTSGNILYVDTSSNVQPNLRGNYVSYNVTNDTGSPIADAWVAIGSFTGSYVSLAAHETGLAHLGPLPVGATRTVFFYLNVDCSSFSAGQCNVSTAQPFAVQLYSGRPTTNLLDSQSFSVTVQETIAAQANKVTTVVTSSNSPTLGALITVTVTGNTGQIGSGKLFYASPETYFDFPANSFRLYSTSVTFSGGNAGTYLDQLLVPSSAFTSTAATDYSFVATYQVIGPTSGSTAVSPVAFISSGNATKHTGTSSYASFPPIGTTSNSLIVTKLVNSSLWPSGGIPTYTVRVTDSASSSVTLDDLVDFLPVSPASVTYLPGSATFAGNPIADPSISGSTLTWTGIFVVPANGSADLTFQASVPNVGGTYTNSAIAHISSTQIDSTLSTSDDSPATVSLSVGTPDLTISKTHMGNFAQGQTGASYSITASNGGTGITTGTVAVTDTLPAGLTATGMSGTGWSCTLGTLSCTRSDALGAGSSYPAITLNVNVANSAAASVTNTATVSGGGESNTANNSASDVTTVTQLPDLTIAKTHMGNFTQGQAGASYSITVSNGGAGTTNNMVTATDTLPAGLTATGMSGTGWICTLGTLSCTRSDALAAGGSYPAITLTVNVASNAAASVTNTATVSGGGESNTANNSASDVTTVAQLPDLTIAKTHIGNFTQGQAGASYSITVSNGGAGTTNGMVTVTDTLPAGLTATGMSGTGWICTLGTLSCTRSDALAAGGSYPAITLTVNVASNAAASVTNTAAVSGGGESNTANDSATDATTIAALIPAATATTLTISPDASVNAGTTITMTAAVLHGATPVFPGLVTFCDASASQCTGTAILGTAQLTNSGSATLTLILSSGNYSIKAVFAGTSAFQSSESAPQTLVVNSTAGYASTTTIAASGGSNSYTLTGTVAAFGKPVPTGTVSFLDTSFGNAAVGSAPLDPASLGFLLSRTTASPAVNGSPNFATAADFDNDGKIDLAVPNGSANTVSVFLGNGDGTFQPQASYSAGASGNAYAVAVGDFNADGNPDLVVTNVANGSATISVLMGHGDGTFELPVTHVVGNYPSAVVVGDFNGDGNADIAVADRDDNTISVLLGNGDGTFQAQTTYASGNSPVALVALSLKGDGILDLVAANASDNTLSVLLGNGDGTFQAQATYAVGTSPVALAAEDLNGDGNVDLVAANASDNTLSVLLGSGNGTLQPQMTYSTGNSPAAVVTTDLDGDGKVDLVVTNGGDNTLSVLLGKGDGTFQPAITIPVGAGPGGLAAGDYNGDGLTDVASVANTAPSKVTVLLSQHTVVATATGVSLSTPGTHEVLASYAGDDDHAPSQSAPIALAGPALTATTTVLGASPNPTSAGQAVTFTATVSPTPGGTPAGTMSFYDGATLLGTVAVNSGGIATLTTSSLPLGANTITAIYSGNATFAGSTSSTLTETVAGSGLTSTTTQITASANPATAGQQVTFTATVSPAPTGTPAGTVSFYNGATLLGTGMINLAGVATFATSNLGAGNATITAVYSGNAGFATSTSTPLNLTVAIASVYTVTAPQTPFTVVSGESLDVNVTVQPVGGAYNSLVTMSASGLPAGAVAIFTPLTVTPGAAGAPTVMTIRTATQTAGIPADHNPQFPLTPTFLAAGAMVLAVNRKRLGKSMAVFLVMATLLAGAWMMAGCNGGFAGKPGPQTRTYIITITGTSGSLHPSTTITLIVR